MLMEAGAFGLHGEEQRLGKTNHTCHTYMDTLTLASASVLRFHEECEFGRRERQDHPY